MNTRFSYRAMWVGMAALCCVQTACIILESSPTYTPPGASGEPPCDALPGTSEPVYVCEDVTQGVLFVSEMGQDDAPGTREEPVQTLQQALLLAREQSDKKVVLVAGSPSFVGQLKWSRPLDLLGGFDEAFEVDDTAHPEIIHQGESILVMEDLMSPVRISHLDVILEAGGETLAVPAVSIKDAILVHLHDVNVVTPDGTDGVDGMAGGSGQDGTRGLPGGSGTRIAPGDPGTNMSCPDARGGQGGRGGDPAGQEMPGEMSPLGAMGGRVDEPGEMGRAGTPGEDGQDATLWSLLMPALPAMPGQPGAPGQGGGGGGGGDDLGVQGGGGGGGGAGGCGGEGGTPGTSGGWSLGVALERSALELSGKTTIQTGHAGRAGRGGAGGSGGMGAEGGMGSLPATGGIQGGRGGAGGAGGMGGRGGHGQPGQSVGVLCVESLVKLSDEAMITPGDHGAAIDGNTSSGDALSGCMQE